MIRCVQQAVSADCLFVNKFLVAISAIATRMLVGKQRLHLDVFAAREKCVAWSGTYQYIMKKYGL